VLAWNGNKELPLASDALADARTTVILRDVADVIRESPGAFDAIMLDVDNGPAELSSDGNHRLYDRNGLQFARAALKPGGCLAFWSATQDPAFEKRLAAAGFIAETRRCRAHGTSGGLHTIFLGRIR
jgi:spermidine synthase